MQIYIAVQSIKMQFLVLFSSRDRKPNILQINGCISCTWGHINLFLAKDTAFGMIVAIGIKGWLWFFNWDLSGDMMGTNTPDSFRDLMIETYW